MQLSPELTAACDEYDAWWHGEQQLRDIAEQVDVPLYHYTDAGGLVGILKSQEIWFTSIYHMNDPSELAYGTKIACRALNAAADGKAAPVKAFCETVASKLSGDIAKVFGYYVASFSRLGDDLGQWRGYGNNGRGYALGLAPHLFHPNDKRQLPPDQTVFVANVEYDMSLIERRNRDAVGRAVGILQRAIDKRMIASAAEGSELQKELSIRMIPALLWHSITAKHRAYSQELETRLMIVNGVKVLAPFISMRTRGPSLVPFIKSPMPLQQVGSITEIVIGPAADDKAEDGVHALLHSIGLQSSVTVRRSEIPYKIL